MRYRITLKNYRCFTDEKPCRFDLGDGFVALVGVNNSGKSSLLRFFYEFRPVMASAWDSDLAARLAQDESSFSGPNVHSHSDVFTRSNNRDLTISVEFEGPPGILEGESDAVNLVLKTVLARSGPGQITLTVNGVPYDRTWDRKPLNFDQLRKLLRPLYNSLYVGSFRNAINVGGNESYFDIAVGQGFVEKWRSLKTGQDWQSNEATFTLTDSIKRIFGFDSLEINASQDGKTLQVFVDGRSYRLAELGSGLAQFIIVLANAALVQPDIIFIDEPEINLHPSLQLDFLTILGAYASRGVMFATHSIGLARASADRIYGMRMVGDASIVAAYESLPRLAEFVGELSFSGYQQLGFSRILLVEGPTEVKTVQQLLRVFGKDHEVVLLPLGGSSLIRDGVESELIEVMRITGNVSALIDSERSAETDSLPMERRQFLAICSRLGIDCHVMERRAIENYFSQAAIQRIKGSKYDALGPFDALSALEPGWSKQENWRIAREMTVADLAETDLGRFIEGLEVG